MNTQTGRSGNKPHIRALHADEVMPPKETSTKLHREISIAYDKWLERKGLAKYVGNHKTNSWFKKRKK